MLPIYPAIFVQYVSLTYKTSRNHYCWHQLVKKDFITHRRVFPLETQSQIQILNYRCSNNRYSGPLDRIALFCLIYHYLLTDPVLSSQRSESIHIVLAVSVEVHRSIQSPLEDGPAGG